MTNILFFYGWYSLVRMENKARDLGTGVVVVIVVIVVVSFSSSYRVCNLQITHIGRAHTRHTRIAPLSCSTYLTRGKLSLLCMETKVCALGTGGGVVVIVVSEYCPSDDGMPYSERRVGSSYCITSTKSAPLVQASLSLSSSLYRKPHTVCLSQIILRIRAA